MPWWSPRRVAGFLTTWTLATPFKVIIVTRFTPMHVTGIYAALWTYAPGNPIYPSPVVVDILYTLLMIPFYAPGLAIAWFAWHSTTDQNMTRMRYVEIVLALQMVHLLVVWLGFPCPISETPHLCSPTTVTGILALFFAPKRVEETASPWA